MMKTQPLYTNFRSYGPTFYCSFKEEALHLDTAAYIIRCIEAYVYNTILYMLCLYFFFFYPVKCLPSKVNCVDVYMYYRGVQGILLIGFRGIIEDQGRTYIGSSSE